MSRRPEMYVDDMLEALRRVTVFSEGLDLEGFMRDIKTQDAVIRNLEILGEAAKKIPESIKTLDTSIPWRRIMGMRDVLAHDYFGIDEQILWDVVSFEVPSLAPRLEALKEQLS